MAKHATHKTGPEGRALTLMRKAARRRKYGPGPLATANHATANHATANHATAPNGPDVVRAAYRTGALS